MKKFFMLFVAAAVAFNLYAQDTEQKETPVEGPVITFETETIDYGTVEQGADGKREVKFTNTGTEPLVISNCQGTCGCTVPTCPKETILPGESGTIVVKYATDRLGAINKAVKIYSNASAPDKPIMIQLKGNVIAKQATGEPVTDPHAGHPH